jgi:ATP-dependent helicase/nuclease subunit A
METFNNYLMDDFKKKYPLASRLQPSAEQLPAVIERDRAVVMTAGAGTGKTRTLVARYLSLLEDDYNIRSIVAVTFTKKAASEMRNRIRTEIQRYLAEPGRTDGELSKWRRIYSQLDFARISTIHSICSELLRYHPVEADIDPNFTVLEERDIALMLKEAAESAVAAAAADPEMQFLFDMLSPEKLLMVLKELLVNAVESRGGFNRSSLINHDLSTLKPMVLKKQAQLFGAYGCALVKKGVLARLFDLCPIDITDERAMYVISLQDLFTALGYSRSSDSFTITEDMNTFEKNIPLIHSIEKFNLNKGKAGAWANGKEGKEESKEVINQLRDPIRRKSSILFFKFPDEKDKAYVDFLRLLKMLFFKTASLFEAMKRASGGLDFNDLEYRSLETIRKNRNVKAFWNREVSWFLIDEFQDTNSSQRDLLTAMAGDRKKLFLVGDAKQSIYGFRGADVSVFRNERLLAEKQGDSVLALTGSYRSHMPLMDTLNCLFERVFPDEDPNRPWLEPYQGLIPRLQVSGKGFTSEPFVEFVLASAAKEGPFANSREQAACASALRIIEWVENKKCDYGDIAVLARAGTSFIEFEKVFSQMNIPFIVNAGKGYFDQPEIRDVLNALKAADKPYRNVSLTGYLRSPVSGLSDEDIFLIFIEYRKACAGRMTEVSLYDFLSSCLKTDKTGFLNSRAQILLGRSFEILNHIISIINRAPVERVITEFIEKSDYFSFLIRLGLTRSRMNLNKLIARAHDSRITDTGEFLTAIEESLEMSIKESQANQTQKRAVQIMSAHASKGLEFPVVIIANAGYGKSRRTGMVMDEFFGPVYPDMDDLESPSIKAMALETETDRLDAEILRILYVAATRAKEKLVFTSPIRLSSDNTLAGLAGWLKLLFNEECLDMCKTVFPGHDTSGDPDSWDEWKGIEDRKANSRAYYMEKLAGKVGITYYPETWKPSEEIKASCEIEQHYPVLSGKPYFLRRKDGSGKKKNSFLFQRVKRKEFSNPSDLAIEAGTVVHNCLDAWLFPDTQERTEQIQKYIRLHALKRGIISTEGRCILEKRCISTLQMIRNCKWFCTFFETARNVYHEYPFYRQESKEGAESLSQSDSGPDAEIRLVEECGAVEKTQREKRLREVLFNDPYDIDPLLSSVRPEKKIADAVVVGREGTHHIIEFKTLRLPGNIKVHDQQRTDEFIISKIKELEYDIQLSEYGILYREIKGILPKLIFCFFAVDSQGEALMPRCYELDLNTEKKDLTHGKSRLKRERFIIKTVIL